MANVMCMDPERRGCRWNECMGVYLRGEILRSYDSVELL